MCALRGTAPPVREDAPDLARPALLLLLVGGLVADLAGFFTLAALVTFGGAYAVLPFVADAAVNHYGWLPQTTWSRVWPSESPHRGRSSWSTPSSASWPDTTSRADWPGDSSERRLRRSVRSPSFVFIISGAPLIDRIRTTVRSRRTERDHDRCRRSDRRARRLRRPPRRLLRRSSGLARDRPCCRGVRRGRGATESASSASSLSARLSAWRRVRSTSR